jgi:hypothetical protein
VEDPASRATVNVLKMLALVRENALADDAAAAASSGYICTADFSTLTADCNPFNLCSTDDKESCSRCFGATFVIRQRIAAATRS